MTDFFPRLFIGALLIVGVWTCFDKKMIFGRLGDWMSRLLPKWVTMPLYDCPMCMASVWGTTFWFLSGGEVSRWWPIYVLALCGFLKLIAVEFLNK